jgi:hypothetical protein
MGKGSRPDSAKALKLVPGTGGAAAGPPVGVMEPPPPPADPPVATGDQLAVVAEEREGGVAAPEPDASRSPREEPPGYPTHLEAGLVANPSTPDDVLATLNHLALRGAIDESQFQELYLHHFGPLGATHGAAHQHWEALAAKREAELQAARELAEQMQAAIAAADVQPWNPLDDTVRAGQEVDQVRHAFNAAVDAAGQEAAKRHRATGSHLKDEIATELSQRSGLSYTQANDFVSAWAGTSNDHNWRSIALQVAAAEKFNLEPPDYIAKVVPQFATHPNWGNAKDDARRFVDAMYERTQEWLESKGIKELVLFRGMVGTIGADTAPVDAAAGPLQASVHLNPLNSWTAKYDTSYNFSHYAGYVLTARVHASKVIGCCFTGLGCLGEQEFVVAGGQNQQVMAVANSKVRYDHLSGTAWKA